MIRHLINTIFNQYLTMWPKVEEQNFWNMFYGVLLVLKCISPSSCSWALIVVGRQMGGIYPGPSAASTGCDHWLQTSAFHEGSAIWGQSGGSLTWCVVVHWVQGSGVSWMIYAKYSPQLSFDRGHYTWVIQHSEMVATCAWLGDSQQSQSVSCCC